MTAYLLLGAFIALCAALENDQIANVKPAAIASAAAMAIFAGLRYETGYDWLEYESFFYSLGTFLDSSNTLEPGFGLLSRVIRSAGFNFEIFQLVVAAINMAALYILSAKFTGRPALVLLLYFGLNFLPGQMAAIRQSLAYSFTFFAIAALADKRTLGSVALNIVAATCHSFSIVTAPLMYLKVRPPSPVIVTAISVLGLIAALSGLQLWLMLTEIAMPLLPGFLSSRLNFYTYATVTQVSPFALILTIWHLACYWLIYIKDARPQDHPVLRFSLWLIVLTLFAHSWLASFPGVWNRLMLIAVPLEAILLTRAYRLELRIPQSSVAAWLGVSAASLAALFLQLNRPEMLPYKPYQFAPYHWITGAPSDGRSRYLMQMRRSYEDIQRQRG